MVRNEMESGILKDRKGLEFWTGLTEGVKYVYQWVRGTLRIV